ncbi:MAG: helix-turn-helix transcriptional regulator [Gemmatimonadaceae bacterium]|nr:helix-turn-helix transcriptional regulator [Gemmatimonadaceae bacterium]MDQ3244495.1 helix-turn-helix domain-containing protein [Gemmatimonadota bacterium]
MTRTAAELLALARTAAGLSQRDLARKAGTAQSVVARIELGETSPSWNTLTRLVRATGSRLHATIDRPVAVDQSLLDDVPRILAMTPEQRLLEVAQVSRFIAAARRA